MTIGHYPVLDALFPAVAVITVAAALLALPATAPPARAADRPGVRAGGVDLSGLLVADAAAKLQATLEPAFARPISVNLAGRVFHLTAKDAKVPLRRAAHGQARLLRRP